MSIIKILEFISQAVALIPLFIALVNYKYIHNYVKPLFLYILVSVTTELVIFTLNALHYEIILVLHIYTLLEFILISFFYIVFLKAYFKPYVIYAIIGLFICASIGFYFISDLQHADQYDMAIESIIFTCYCLYLYYFLLKHLMFDNLTQTPVFWLNTGILFYFAGNFTIFIFSSYITSPNHLTGGYSILWKSIHTFFNVAMNLLFGIGFWKTREK